LLVVAHDDRGAGVDRSFLYRHQDLLGQIHALAAQPAQPATAATPSRASLQADLLNAQQRTTRLAARNRQLEQRLSELLGEQTWHASGLGAPDDIDQLKQQVIHLEQQVVDLRLQLEEREQDLDAARAANRELLTHLNTSPGSPTNHLHHTRGTRQLPRTRR
jgi:chromosome segregation ATPase